LIRTLFFYGVLMPGLVSGRMAELVALLGPPRPATVSGRLFAVPDPRGHYPVMVATAGAERVSGAMLAPGPSFGAVELAELDAFEGFDPADPSGSDYIRAGLHAMLADGLTLEADAYQWNRIVGVDFIAIPHGDFARYLAEGGATPLPG
jgi:gamma-glutamylcyclotransferase (GGCT)/AIG2-like uncharacterized protein YtfP